MDFLGSISRARSHAWAAIAQLDRYDHAAAPAAPHNRQVLDAATRHISPGATTAGSAALDAARWERWVSVRQVRDTGHALELLDRAWWSLGARGGYPDVHGARRTLHDAVAMLDRARHRGWSVTAPHVTPWRLAA